MMHPNDETLLRYRFDTLEADEAKVVADHLRTCTGCAARFAAVGKSVEALAAFDAEAELDPAVAARALDKVRAVQAERAGLGASAAPATAGEAEPQAGAAPGTPQAAAADGEDPDRVRSAERPQLGFLAWLGFAPGASFPQARRYASLAFLGAAVLLGAGEAYVGLREVKTDTRLEGARELPAGGRAYARIEVENTRTGAGLADAAVGVALVAGGKRYPLFEGKTGPGGVAHAALEVPDQDFTDATLEVTTRGRGEEDVLTQPVVVGRDYKVHLSTDKPLYQPGQTIHVRALALKSPSLAAAADREVVFEVQDPRGNRLSGRTVKSSRFGVAAWDVELASEIALGDYKVAATVEGRRSEVPVKLARYTLPKFKLTLKGARDSFLAGETLRADLRARYFFGKPVDKAQVRAVLTREDGTLVGAEVHGTTDKDGDVKLEFELPTTLAQPGTPESLALQVEVKDAAGQQEQKSQAFVVSRELLTVEVLPDLGGVSAQWPTTLYVLTTTPEGRPVPCDVTLTTPVGQPLKLRTQENGVGAVTLPSFQNDGRNWVEVEASGPDGRRAQVRRELQARHAPFHLDTDRALYRPGEPITLDLAGLPGAAQLRVFKDGRVVHSQQLEAQRAAVALPAGLSGSLELEVTAPDARDGVTRHVIVAEPGGLSVRMTADQDTHRPGETAKLRFEVKDPSGRPVVAALGLSVVDESLWALTASSPAQARAFFLLEQSLLKPRGQLSAADLLAGKSFGDAEQLAARVLLSGLGASARAAGFSQSSRAAEAQQLAQDKRAWNAFSGGAFAVMGLLFGLLGLVALVRFAPGVFLPVFIMVATFAATSLAPWDMRSAVFWLGVITYVVVALALSVSRGAVTWGFAVVPAVLVLVVVFFGDNLRRLFGMSADALGGDSIAYRPASPSVGPSQKSLKSFGGGDGYAEDRGPRPVEEVAAARAPPSAPGAVAGGKAEGATDTGAAPPRRQVRVRQSFPETMAVHPELITDEAGVATLELPLADSITDWRLSALASSADGRLGTMDAPVRVFQDFFVDVDTPVALVRGDQATVPVAVHNYLTVAQTIRLEVKAEDWFRLVGPSSFTLALEGGEVGGQELRIKVLKPGRHTLTLKADGTDLSDAVARPMLVTEAGQQKTVAVGGTLKPGETTKVVVTVPEGAVPGSTSLMLKVFPSALASALDGLEGSLQAPHGCFEQTSSTTYPNVLVWNYLKHSGKKKPEVEARARAFVALGYQRLLTFEVPGGGFEWFGRAPANQILTAYGLMEFRDMAQVFPVDEKLIERTQAWLVSKQQSDGSWNPDSSSLSDGLWKSGFSGQLMVTAYVGWSLAESGYQGRALERALAYLAANQDNVRDTYTQALVAATFARAGHPGARAAVASLVSQVKREKDLAWFAPSEATVYYGRGLGGSIENTALAAYALMLAKQDPELVKALLGYLAANRSPSGAWASTQATVLALRALLFATTGSEADHALAVKVNGADSGRLLLKASADAPALADLAAGVKPGLNVVELTGQSEAQFQVVAIYTQAWRDSAADADEPLSLKVNYGRTKTEVGAIVPVDLTVTYRGEDASGMVVVSVGTPAGLAPLPEDLQGLVASGAVARFELAADAVNLYLDRLPTGQPQRLALRFKARSKVDTQGVGSLAYLYYHPAVKAAAPAVAVLVN